MSVSTVPSPSSGTPRWAGAVVLALLWHVLVVGGMTWLDPFAPDPESAVRTPVEIVFAPTAEPAERSDSSLPRNFTELPPNRADQPPKIPDASSNVDSRARDRATDGPETDLPRSEGLAENPSVAMQPAPVEGMEGQAEIDPENPAPQSIETPTSESTDAPEADGETERIGRRAEIGERVTADPREGGRPADDTGLGEGVGNPREEMRRGRIDVSPEPRFLIGAGIDDVPQEGMNNPTGNVQLFGDISLNTVAWDFAPWLQRFRRDFYRSWVAPYAYYLGLIEGDHVVEVEIAPDGELLRVDVISEQGHESLREATVGNFRGIAPYQPLPDDFPEPTLRMTVHVFYRQVQ